MRIDYPKCGYVEIIGRTNVGKSTLLNHLIGKKISITSRKKHTTIKNIIGIKTKGILQTIYIDTPGFQINSKKLTANINFNEINIILFIVDSLYWKHEDQKILDSIKKSTCPIIITINKIDRIKTKQILLSYISFLKKKIPNYEIIPISAKHNINIDKIEKFVNQYTPISKHIFHKSQVTTCSSIVLSEELVREQIFRQLGDELPYNINCKNTAFVIKKDIYYINIIILVKRKNHKKIILGKNGTRIKNIGENARKYMEILFKSKVMLTLFVK